MTDVEKISRIKKILDISGSDELLAEYLSMAKSEILNWLYSNMTKPASVSVVPEKYEQVQVMAVVAGYSIRGAENQTRHNELDVERTFKYSDMIDYIHAHVDPYIGIPGYENAD